MHNIMRDMRVCFRQLRKAPGFALTTILTLALGIGATTAIFSLVNTVLLKPLPFYQQERLAWINGWDSRLGHPTVMSYPDFFDYRAQQKSFIAIASYHSGTHTLTGRGEARHLEGQVVSSDFFRILGVKPTLGRDLTRDDENVSNRSVMLSHSLWESAFNSDPQVVGKPITLDGIAYNVIGVMPATFSFPVQQPAPQFWSSVAEDAYDPDGKGKPPTVQRGAHFLDGIGRLRDGVSISQAQADLTSVAASLSLQYPKSNKRFNAAHVESELNHLVGDSRTALRMLFAAVTLVLLIACANVAGLMLARASRRRSEMAVRAAIGAGRTQIVHQVLAESVVLSVTGGALGLLLAAIILRGFVHLLPRDLPRLNQVSIDVHVLLFALLASIGTGILFGVFPAWKMSQVNPSLAMREGSHSVTSDRKQHRLHSALVIAETALGLVLLVGSGLLIRSFVHMLHVDPGFQPTNVLTARIDLPYTDLNKFTRFYEDLQERMSAQPGVDSVGAAFALPFWSDGIRITFDIEGRPNNPGEEPSEELGIVTPGYFRTMRIPLISGRVFEPTDTDKAPLVAMVNRAFADKYFPGEDPVGKVFEPGISDGRTKGKRRIIGVVGNTKRFDLTAGPSPEYFLPLSQCVAVPPAIVIRSSGDPMSLLGPLREQVKQIDANVPLFEVRTMGDYLSTATATPRFQTVLLTAFAGMALLLASIGLYAILSYMVAQRTTEIGLRMALGAQRSAVMRMVLRKGLALAGIGLALGVALALIVTRFLQSMLFGVKSFDALTFTSVAAVLLSVALIASAAPALRAARLDPMRTLREQ